MSDTQTLNLSTQSQAPEFSEKTSPNSSAQDLASTLAQFRRGISSDIRKSETPKPTNPIHYIYDSRTQFDNSWMEVQLLRLHQLLIHNKQSLLDAFSKDYGLNKYEVEIMEYNPVVQEIKNLLDNFKTWRNESLNTAFPNSLSESRTLYHPHGVVLIMGSQKESLSSILIPLATSIAAGNYNLLIPQTLETGETSAVKKFTLDIISQLDQDRVKVIFGKTENFDLNSFLGENKVDMIFSTRSHQESMRNYRTACEHNVEFKSHSVGWNIGMVDQFADLDYAAKLIVQKKFYKSGQDVNNLDTVFVHKNVSKAFLTMVKDYMYNFYAKKNGETLEYGKIYDTENFARIMDLVKPSYHEGSVKTRIYSDENNLTINPVIITNPKIGSTLMEKKILGPVLPIIEYTDPREVQAVLNSRDNVENMFYFTKNGATIDLVERMYKFKNLYFNDTNIPISSGHVRKSGVFSIGNNELIGKYGIHTFSRQTLFYHGLNFNQGFIGKLSRNPVIGRINRKSYLGLISMVGLGLGYRYLS